VDNNNAVPHAQRVPHRRCLREARRLSAYTRQRSGLYVVAVGKDAPPQLIREYSASHDTGRLPRRGGTRSAVAARLAGPASACHMACAHGEVRHNSPARQTHGVPVRSSCPRPPVCRPAGAQQPPRSRQAGGCSCAAAACVCPGHHRCRRCWCVCCSGLEYFRGQLVLESNTCHAVACVSGRGACVDVNL